MRCVKDALITSVRVAGGHSALDDAEILIENLGERRKAIRGARRVRNNVGRRVILVSVDADDVRRDVVSLRRSGDDNLLCAGLNVLASARSVEENTSSLNDYVNAHLLPGEVERVTVRNHLDGLSIHGDGRVIDNLDVSIKSAEDRVVLEQVCSRLCSARLVHAHNFEGGVCTAGHPAADKVAP